MKGVFLITLLVTIMVVTYVTPVVADSGWNVKYYSDPAICSNPGCVPGQIYFETTVPGDIFHMNYPDGKVNGLGNDRWGSIWRQTINFSEGNYVFYASHDDGVMIFLNNTNIMDVGVSENNNLACPARHLNGNVDVTVIHKNTGGPANINVWWTKNESDVCLEPVTDKFLNVYTGEDGSSWVVYENYTERPVVHYWKYGQETVTQAYWQVDGTNLWMYIPDEADSFLAVDSSGRFLIPLIHNGAESSWYIENGWLKRKSVFVTDMGNGLAKVTYTHGSRLQVSINYQGGTAETNDTLWQTDNDIDFYFITPANAITFELHGGSRPIIDANADWSWANEPDSRIVAICYIFVQKNNLGKDEIIYATYANPTQVKIYYYLKGDNTEHSTLFTQDSDFYLYFQIPENLISFKVDKGPVPAITPEVSARWENGADRWVVRKAPVFISIFLPFINR